AAAVDTPIVVGQLGKPRLVHRVFRRWMRHNAHIEVIEPPSAVLFGDAAGEVYALDARDGALLWKSAPGRSAGAAVSAAPVVYGDRLYVPLGPPARDPRGEGEVVALDLSSGSLAWRAQMPRSLLMNAGASGLPASPTIDARRGALYVAAGGEGAIVALSLLDGSPRWVAKPAEPVDPDAAPGPADPPILQTLPNGHQVLLAANAAGVAFCLDPDRNGAPLWQTRLVAGAEDVDWSHAADHRNVYVAVADRRRRDGHARGVLAAVDIASGKLRWLKNAPPPNCVQGPACARIHAHSVSVIPGIVFGASIGGHLRAYSTVDGSVVWDFDTARSFQATDGSVARGGRLGRGGATVVDGMVYLDAAAAGDPRSASGVLLAFSAGAK
ncbi:MAG: PQQ-like beta-propeller repeat protein, partial [Gammaproteobacteria bacterium]|nr:PQQ-like beta-propeller repeat protein [Gammaproteobacteria bacterium]